MTDTSTTISTAEIIAANLRAAADLIAAHTGLRPPYVVTRSDGTVDLSWYLNGRDVDQKAAAAAIVKAIDGAWSRSTADYAGPLATWTQERGGLSLLVQVDREQVCERIVTGTEEVTLPAVEAKPERTETREVVEWRCTPLLADDEPAEQVSA